MSAEYLIPACSGMRIDVKKGESITVIDVEGGQVVDFLQKLPAIRPSSSQPE